jgi:flagellar motility protein MotE (MotC chaperone)
MKLRTPLSESKTMTDKTEWVDQQPEPKKILARRTEIFEEQRVLKFQQDKHMREANEWIEIAEILENKSNQVAWNDEIQDASEHIEAATGKSYDYWYESYQWKADKLKELALDHCCKASDLKKKLESKSQELEKNWKDYRAAQTKAEEEYDKLLPEKEETNG